MTRQALGAALDAAAEVDSTPLLAAVAAPAVVLHRSDISRLPVSIARELAARLRDARLMILDGESTAPYLGDVAEIAQTIEGCLAEPDQPLAALHEPATSVLPRHRPAAPSSGESGLTPREVQLVRLLASGLTNDEIAEQLVLSVRTVERHISNIYDKLGVRGRANGLV